MEEEDLVVIIARVVVVLRMLLLFKINELANCLLFSIVKSVVRKAKLFTSSSNSGIIYCVIITKRKEGVGILIKKVMKEKCE